MNVVESKYCGLSDTTISCAVLTTTVLSSATPVGYPFVVSVMNNLTGTEDVPVGLDLKYTLIERMNAPFGYVAPSIMNDCATGSSVYEY